MQVMPGTEHTANANSAYSQLTRAQEEAHIYLDRETHGDEPQEALAESWSKRVEKRTSLSRLRERELMEQTAQPPHEKTEDERKKETVEQDGPTKTRRERQPEPKRNTAPADEQQQEHEAPPSNVAVEEREEEEQQQTELKGGSPLRERFSHIRQPERESGRDTDRRDREKFNDRQDKEAAAGRHFRHIRTQEQDHGRDIGR